MENISEGFVSEPRTAIMIMNLNVLKLDMQRFHAKVMKHCPRSQ